ncbi:MAG: porin [Planctomycetota bacterium]
MWKRTRLEWPLLGLLGLFASAADAAAQESQTVLRWTVGDGLKLAYGDFEGRIRPRFHFDLVDPRFREVQESIGGSFEENRDVRRARLLGDFGFRDGSALEHWSLRAQVDFADSVIDWKDLVASYSGLPALFDGGRSLFRFGHFREPFGLEAMSSVSHLPFIERSAASNAFTPGRSRGLQWSERTDAALVQVGAFRRAAGEVFPNELGDETAVTARALWQRGREPFGDFQLVQLGGTLSFRDANGDGLRFDARPGSRLLGRVVDTGTLDAEHGLVYGLESLFQWDRSSLVVEAFGATVDEIAGDPATAQLTGGHIGYFTFLTEDHAARWNPRRGGVRSPTVADGIHEYRGGNGALEGVARLTWVDLQDGAVTGGRSLDLEVGLNWYLQPTTRFMLHWLGGRFESPSGDWVNGSAVLGRIQVQL